METIDLHLGTLAAVIIFAAFMSAAPILGFHLIKKAAKW